MPMGYLSEFTQNAILLLLLVFISDLLRREQAVVDSGRTVLARGVYVGVAAILTMLAPLRLEPGLLLDTRGLMLAMSGVFFGPAVTVIAAAMTMIARIVLGGDGLPSGLAFILGSAGLGLTWRSLREGKVLDFRWYDFAVLGLVVAGFQLVLAHARLESEAHDRMWQLAPSILLVSAVATALMGRILQDRQRRHEAFDALTDREDSFRTLTEHLPAIVYRAALDEHSTTLYVSPAITSLGFSVEDWMANPDLFVERLHPDDRERVLAQLAADRAANRGSELVYRFQHADGRWRVIRDSAQIVYYRNGAPRCLQGLMLDITAEREAQAQLQLQEAALHAAADAIVILDRDAVVQWANPAFTQLTGYPLHEAVGQTPKQLLRSGRQPREFYTDMWDRLLAGEVWSGQLINRRRDGTEYTEEQTITPVRDAQGEVSHFIAIKRDVTQRVQLEAQLHQAQRLEGIGRLAGGVAHDFNNLLTVINGTVEMALPLVPEESEVSEDLRSIRRAADRGARLTKQLLAFSRQQVLQPQLLDANSVVRELGAMFTRVLGERITLDLHLAPDLDPIRADSGQLGQVLMNLVVNARDAMPNGGRITVTTENVLFDADDEARHVSIEPGPYVGLYVSDTGIGMDAATRDRIFEPFFTTKPVGKGTGLGLPTVYGIVKQSGGAIWVYSEPGRGTTFKLYFPRIEGAVVERSSGPSTAVHDSDLGGHETVLVVEDEDAIRLVASKVLAKKGYTVISASSGEEALALLDATPTRLDLLVTDMVMPGITGPELAVQLRERQPQVKVLFTSGYSRDAVKQQFGLTDGHFISKPYGLAELARAVRGVLDG